MELKEIEQYDRNEVSMIDVAHAIIKEAGVVTSYNNILIGIQEYLGLSEEELEENMVLIYTALNVDGRFISLGDNNWGLRSWYAIDEIDEEIISSLDDDELPQRRRKRSSVFDDMIDYNADDPEDDLGYGDDDYEDDDDDDDGLSGLSIDEELAETDELDEYESDLDELGEDVIDDDDGASFEEDDDDEDDEDEE